MAFTARSESTRTAILRAARQRFAGDGYERATIRAIAADAGIDPSMVMRYFGSKDRLFTAATDVDLHLPDLTGVPRRQVGETLVRHFLKVWEGESNNEMLLILFRSAVTNEAAAQRLRETAFRDQVLTTVGAVVTDGTAPTRASLVGSQLLGIAVARYILRLPPMVALDTEALVALVGPVIQRYLTAPLPPEVGHRPSDVQ